MKWPFGHSPFPHLNSNFMLVGCILKGSCSGGYTRFPNGPTEWCCTAASELTTEFQLIAWKKVEGANTWIGRDVDCVNEWHGLTASKKADCKNKFKAEGVEEELWPDDEL